MKRPKTITEWVNEYVTRRRMLGFRMDCEQGELTHFARYIMSIGKRGPLQSDWILDWLQISPHASRMYQAWRLSILRSFAKYIAIYEPKTEIPPGKVFGAICARPEPYIYSERDLIQLFEQCEKLKPAGGLRSRTYRLLFGLLSVTGLRVSEAIRLNDQDVDLSQGVLKIRDTKFRKSRLVPLHPSTTEALYQYVQVRDQYHPTAQSKAFLVSEKGHRLVYVTVQGIFNEMRRQISWDLPGRRLPRIHDLRHTFVCRRILEWYKEGLDVEPLLPSLSTYLGHVKVSETYWYLTGIPELMEITAKKFEHFIQRKAPL